MRPRTVVAISLVLVFLLAGCTGRDIESEAKDREQWARDHNDHAPVAILSGPDHIQPGALVWYSAYGSHDPDFFGAKRSAQRDQARQAGGVHVTTDAASVHHSWYIALESPDGDRSLGAGIREYRWQVDDGPVLVAHELTHRYGSEDGPWRFPVGFPEPGRHTLRLMVVDWSGATDAVEMEIEVAAGGVASTIPGFQATAEGWELRRTVAVEWQQYGACPMVGSDAYDPSLHHVVVPWDVVFFMQEVAVEATWAPAPVPPSAAAQAEAAPALPGVVDTIPAAAARRSADLNLNDVALTLGHCRHGTVWAVYDDDQTVVTGNLREGGVQDGAVFVQHVERAGAKGERTAAWDFNVYVSDRGNGRWGAGTDVEVRFVFVPATDTRGGGQ